MSYDLNLPRALLMFFAFERMMISHYNCCMLLDVLVDLHNSEYHSARWACSKTSTEVLELYDDYKAARKRVYTLRPLNKRPQTLFYNMWFF